VSYLKSRLAAILIYITPALHCYSVVLLTLALLGAVR